MNLNLGRRVAIDIPKGDTQDGLAEEGYRSGFDCLKCVSGNSSSKRRQRGNKTCLGG